ncbi:zinc metallopeptidase [Clostridium sp. 'White wine YQ']|uniref:zinc metallopeptidase n=1 Tax=Clostridium sp. 'White wine YQ' TaxID=3027474 RepID=UPI002365168E|nr:zinc metallopeptidase [Clostridium sp. 'White wine YQ']MDD7793741.1 zinc metallopeptidase [Clostridium sp. 'White wine YQ']
MFYFDPTMIILIPGIILAMWAQSQVSSTFNKYSRVRSFNGLTGAEVARSILDSAGLFDVSIEQVRGSLTDHYNPRTKVLALSEDVYSSTSVAAIGVAAHEVGHAIQHNEKYAPLLIRNAIVPVANFGNYFSWILILIGIFFAATNLMYLGIVFFLAVVIFQLITLPVEFDASRRAIVKLEGRNLLIGDEINGAKKVLKAAAMTYVAAAANAILQLIRLLAIVSRNDD